MAQWNERDPRWKVEERSDGRNVGAWHWEEKSIFSQVKQRLEDAFKDREVELQGTQAPAGATLRISSCSSVTGEAAINTRKGNKRLCVYDLKLKIEWQAMLGTDSNKPVTGTLSVEEFASACEPEDFMIEVTTKSSGADADAAKHLMTTHGQPEVVRSLVALAKELLDV